MKAGDKLGCAIVLPIAFGMIIDYKLTIMSYAGIIFVCVFCGCCKNSHKICFETKKFLHTGNDGILWLGLRSG
jgi:hypothetical protein